MERLLIITIAIVSGILTYVIANKLNKSGTFASSIVSLTFGIILPLLFKENGMTYALVAACSSYAGMVSVKLVPHIWSMGVVSFISGVLFIIFSSAYQGVGGRLGTIAAIACMTYVGIRNLGTLNIKEKIKENKVFSKVQQVKVNNLKKC